MFVVKQRGEKIEKNKWQSKLKVDAPILLFNTILTRKNVQLIKYTERIKITKEETLYLTLSRPILST